MVGTIVWVYCDVCQGEAYDLTCGRGPNRVFLHSAFAVNTYTDAGVRPHLPEVKGKVNEALG